MNETPGERCIALRSLLSLSFHIILSYIKDRTGSSQRRLNDSDETEVKTHNWHEARVTLRLWCRSN